MPPPSHRHPTQHQGGLCLTKRTHSRRTRNNIPCSVPLITKTAPRRHEALPLPNIPIATAPWQLTRLYTAPLHTATMQQPKGQFLLVKDGFQHNNIISQEAINFLTNRLGKLTGHLHSNQAHANSGANLPQPWAGNYANGASHHMCNYQQLQTADAWPHHGWNMENKFWERFCWYGTRRSQNGAKRH